LQATTRTRTEVRVRADRLRRLAAQRNETIDDVARAARVDRVNLYRLLRGEHSPAVTTRKKLLQHFKVRFDSLFVVVSELAKNSAAWDETRDATCP
jgi:transcriptional regulator with XRE-family HTH domain